MLVLSYALGLLPIDSRVVIALRSIDRAVLKRPVAIGESIRAHAKVSAKRPLGEETGLVTLAVRILNQEDELAARMDLTVLWRAEPAAPNPKSMGGDEDELSPFFEGRLLI
jgi:acyl dehydratase